MINHVNHLGALKGVSGTQDPFAQFNVEFSKEFGDVQGLGDEPVGHASFGDVLKHAIGEIQGEADRAEQLTFDYATGKSVDIHTMMIQVAKADTLMQVTSSVVSKTAQGLNTLLQTQV
jgi:flagellar hook-basal body complex protein FliE